MNKRARVVLFRLLFIIMGAFFLFCTIEAVRDWEPVASHFRIILHTSGLFMTTYLFLNIKQIL